MKFAWQRFLDLASILHGFHGDPGLEEAAHRSAASRAYYAAFHAALEFACEEGFNRTNSTRDHRAVKRHYLVYAPLSPFRSVIARSLGTLQQWRTWADYDDDLRGVSSADLAAESIEKAKRVMGLLNLLRRRT